jgi:hypothetical protein
VGILVVPPFEGNPVKWFKLLLSLTIFVPACAVVGGFSTLDSGATPWWGFVMGAVMGVVFGLVFGGARGGLIGVVYPPADQKPEKPIRNPSA